MMTLAHEQMYISVITHTDDHLWVGMPGKLSAVIIMTVALIVTTVVSITAKL